LRDKRTHLHLERVLGHADRLEPRAEDVVCGRVSDLVGRGSGSGGGVGRREKGRKEGRKVAEGHSGGIRGRGKGGKSGARHRTGWIEEKTRRHTPSVGR
jgi:hypothetical protein